ncbi:MAG: hypothetical protein WA323_04145 [Candidatus Nitrosopolaris sp.]
MSSYSSICFHRFSNIKTYDKTPALGVKDILSINDTLIEKSAYIYRKVLQKRIIKGRSIPALMVASIYAACRESHVPRTLDEIAQNLY